MDGKNNSEHRGNFSEDLTSRSELLISEREIHDKSHPDEHKKRTLSPENCCSKFSKNKDTSRRIHNRENDIKAENKFDGNQPCDVGGHFQETITTIPPTKLIIDQRPIYLGFYPPYTHGVHENYINHNQSNYAMMPSHNSLPICSQWPVINNLTIPVRNVEMSSYVNATSVSNGMEKVTSDDATMVSYPYESLANNTPIFLSNAVLTPPLPGEIKTRREKPDGCRTVYVGNLPEKITQGIITEAFEKCGSISAIRMNQGHFCHIRFEEMESVEQALLLSKYHIKIENKDEPAYNAKIHVDYATAHSDQREFECRKRQIKREERHLTKLVQPPSPPQVLHYTDYEAVNVIGELRNEETFIEAIQVLITWLEKGESAKKNIGTFYSMLQCVNNQAVRLMNKSTKIKEELQKAIENLSTEAHDLQFQLSFVKKVYKTAEMQKNWDLFSKKQRKHIEDWKKNITNISDALISSRVEEDMDLDHDEKLWISREEYDELRQQLKSIERKLEESNMTCSEYYKENLKLKLALENRRESNIFGTTAKAKFC
ncbi:ecto-NOX disulfide-thiol exchanger 1 [Nephila pilipes]|uniref:Ecto-NOX disulfide-thiol exchanger 1 n=1 Tax=Nephila pilipes TaxID=299642 RepID=A0A8X6PVH8_NEPPI|nr:ecto-NOX disulfide-thiol exchanger 1 [Nephila pilipes]